MVNIVQEIKKNFKLIILFSIKYLIDKYKIKNLKNPKDFKVVSYGPFQLENLYDKDNNLYHY